MFEAIQAKKTSLSVLEFYEKLAIFLREFLIGMSQLVVTLRLRGL